MTDKTGLIGRRVLVVEDDVLIAMLIEAIIEDHGGEIVGPFGRLDEALAACSGAPFDMAVLDVNLHGEKVYPVAEALAEQGVPFMLLSGYGQDALPVDQPNWPVCNKPFTAAQLSTKLMELLRTGARSGTGA